MTSGLFNTGITGESGEITGNAMTVQPAHFTSKSLDHDLVSALNTNDLDLNVFGDFDSAFDDPLGDASLDSFMDINALLTENTLLDIPKESEAEISTFATVDPADIEIISEIRICKQSEAKISTFATIDPADIEIFSEVSKKPLKRPFVAVAEADTLSAQENFNSILGQLSPESVDHDYSAKRPKLSVCSEQMSPVEKVFPPAASPNCMQDPSPSPSTSHNSNLSEDKHRFRREKNNIASKRSREVRKQKFVDMEAEAERLVLENARLEKRVVELERLAKQMKDILVAKMAGK